MLTRIWELVHDIYQAYQTWQKDDGNHLAASVSFYTAISFFPLLIVLISTIGLVLRFSGWGYNARQRLLDVIADQTAPTLAEQVEVVLVNVQDKATVSGPLGLLTLLFAAVVVFAQFDDAMDRIWNVPRPKSSGFLAMIRRVLLHRLRAFGMLFGLALFAFAGFVASMSLSALGHYSNHWHPLPAVVWTTMTLTASIGLNWLLFTGLYKWLPKVPVRWSEAARGALVTSLLWEAGRHLLAALVIGSKFSIYGVVGAFVAIMLWVFYATTILFLGAEYIQVFRTRRESALATNATEQAHVTASDAGEERDGGVA